MSTIKQFIVKVTLHIDNASYKHFNAIVTATTKRNAIRKMLFHLNEDDETFAHFGISPHETLHHPKDQSIAINSQLYYPKSEHVEISVEQLNPHADIVYI